MAVTSIAATQYFPARTAAASGASEANSRRATEANGPRLEIGGATNLAGSLVQVQPPPAMMDQLATFWLRMQQGAAEVPTGYTDEPYATVMVNGKPAAVLYNGGGASPISGPAQGVDLEGSGGMAGPDLAMWRAQRYAEALGGTIEIADTALRQQEWSPPPETARFEFTRSELDAAIAAMAKRGRPENESAGTDLAI